MASPPALSFLLRLLLVTCLLCSMTSADSFETYEIINVRSVRSAYVDKNKIIAAQKYINSTEENHVRRKRAAPVALAGAAGAAGAGGGAAGAAGSAAAAGGWTSQLSSAMSVAGNFASVVGAGAQIATVIQGFQQLALQREQMKIQQRQFEAEMELKTIDLCTRICVANWSPWAPCSARCGGGTSRRTRKRFDANMCKGKPCPHSLEEIGICNPGCANNGIPSGNGMCDCPRGFNGPCCNNEIICDFPGKPRHGHLDGTIPSKFGGVISFSCSDGFALVGEEHRVCQANSQWGGTQPKCDKITCSEPEEPRKGQNLNKKALYEFGEEVVFRCQDGYVLTGPEKRKCTNFNGGSDGLWDGFTPLCLPVNCYDPGYPLYGHAQGTEFTLGHTVTFSCQKGFRLVGSESRQCRENGKWSGHEATCQLITCEEPIIPRFGGLRRPRETYRYGITIQYECQVGFQLEGNSTSMCEEDKELSHLGPGGKWSHEPPTCKPTNCGDPGTIENGAKDGSLFYYPNNVTYVCFDGYVLQGANEIHCGYNGVWSAPPPTCNACPLNTFKANGDGRNECFPCPENTHTVTDASNSAQQCICNMGWTGPSGGPCTEILCPPLSAPGNGQANCEGNKYTNKCEFTCDTGYILDKGASRRTCQETGMWTGTDAQCHACPLNTYKSDERSCLPCPVHSYTTNIASVKEQCVCGEGYEGPAGGPCKDTNECSTDGGRGPCDDVCRNTDGSYVCECSIPGWVIDAEVDRHICKLEKSCRNLTETDAPRHGGLVCHWYNEENSQQCAVRCNAGYEFPSRVNNYESCGPTTGYKWSHEERGDTIEPCIEEFFPEFRLEGNSSYFVRKCKELTPDEQQKVKEDFAKMLSDEGICVRRETKVCDAKNVGIICGATRRRRKRGVTEEIDEVNVFFEFASKQIPPSECDKICTMLRIPSARCEALCVPTYKRFLKALMHHTKQSVESLFADRRKVSFRSGQHAFMYNPGTLQTSEVIVDCPPGMKNNETCVPCGPGTYYSAEENECFRCSEHTYQANPQQTSCIPCPRGTYAPSQGSPACSGCPPNKWGDKCLETCHCDHGECSPSNGRCFCHSGWEGPECNIDIQSCTAESCFPGVKCHDIPAPGTGFRCDACPQGLVGDGTFCESARSRRRRSLHEPGNILHPASLTGLSLDAHSLL